MIRLEHLTFTYGGASAPALQDVTLEIPAGAFVLLAGPSGAGKSTLLRCLNGLVPHFSGGTLRGRIAVFGHDPVVEGPSALSRVVGFVFQNPEAQFVLDRVEDEVAFALENLAVPPAEMRARVTEALDLVGLTPLRDRLLETLSGGEKQRVAIAAALALRPRVLVLDEPTSQLDPQSAEEVLEALVRLNRELGLTVVLAEHRLERVLPYATQMIYLPALAAPLLSGPPRQVLQHVPDVPPVVALGRALGWDPLPLTVAESRVADRLSLIAYRLSPVADRASLIACRRSRVAYRGSRIAYRLSRIACCGARVAYRASLIACRGSRVAYRVSLIACRRWERPDRRRERGRWERHSTLRNRRQATRDTRYAICDMRYATRDRRYATRDPRHATRDPRSAIGDRRYATSDRRSAISDRRSAIGDKRSAIGDTRLTIRGLCFRYDQTPVLRDVSLEVAAGELVVLMGRNGAGKTTLLECIVGLLRPQAGTIALDGEPLLGRETADICRRVGYLPQLPDDLLFADTVAEELAVTLRNHGLLDRPPIAPDELLARLGLAELASAYPRDLSVGQRQRVALGAVTVTAPSLLLLDEPTRGMDYAAKAELLRLLRSWQAEGTGVLLVTHDVELAAQAADRVVLLEEGRVCADGTPVQVLTASPGFAPQLSQLFPGRGWLSVEDVLRGWKTACR
jgi:energy-coupling factor transporter ATP-binding protein EcfA2